MHVGIFLEERRRDTSEATALQETVELAEAAEAWGVDGVWLGEIQFNGSRSVQSALWHRAPGASGGSGCEVRSR